MRVAAWVTALLGCGLAAAAALQGQGWRERGLAAFDDVWQTVHDSYYDPSFGGIDWVAVRDELRPRAVAAVTSEEQRLAIRVMLARLGQSHFSLLSSAPDVHAPRGPASVPFDVRVTSSGVLVTRLHRSDGTAVRLGDRLTAIDGASIDALRAGLPADDPRPAQTAWRRVMQALSGEVGQSVSLMVEGADGRTRTLDVARVIGSGEYVTVGNLPPIRASLEAATRQTASGRTVGLIRFNVWMATLAEPIAEAVDRFRQADGFIIDLRGNPGGLVEMIRGVAGHLVNEPVVLGRVRMRELELEFRANPRRSTSDGRLVAPYAGPVAILVDGVTASASECFAGGLQAIGRARVFGTRSAGEALPAATRQLPSGDVLVHAVGDFVRPDGRRLEGIGVVPDEEVPLEPESLAAGRDAEQAALDWIDRLAPRR